MLQQIYCHTRIGRIYLELPSQVIIFTISTFSPDIRLKSSASNIQESPGVLTSSKHYG